MSVERTFGEINKPAELYKKLYELCESLSEDLVEERYLVSTILSMFLQLPYHLIEGYQWTNSIGTAKESF